MGDKGKGNIKAPQFSKDYERGIQIAMKYLPQQLQQELQYRQQYDPQFIEQAMGTQEKYDPRLAQEQLDALQRRDPQWLATHQALGDKIKAALDRGYLNKDQEAAYRRLSGIAGNVDPRYEAAYNKLSGLAGEVDPRQEAAYQRWSDLAGKVDPTQEAAYKQLGDQARAALARGGLDPTQRAMYEKLAGVVGRGLDAGGLSATQKAGYEALGKQRTSDTLRGGTMSPEVLRQRTQSLMAKQPGLSYGEAQDMVQSSGLGIYGEQLKQQRLQGAQEFQGLLSPEAQALQAGQAFSGIRSPSEAAYGVMSDYLRQLSPTQQRQQSLAGFYQAPSTLQQRQQSLGQFSQVMDPTRMQQASLGNFYGLQAPEQNVLGLAGTYIQPSNSITGQLNQIPGVQAPRSFGYVNPNAGYQGVQFGLQNFQNQLAAQQGGGNSSNPWMGALQGAAQGGSYGSNFGGYGAAGGALTGAVAGAFGYPQYSDQRGKINISRTGATTADGIPIVTYEMNGKHYLGVVAQDVEKIRPDAVHHYGNGELGVFYSRIGVELKEL